MNAIPFDTLKFARKLEASGLMAGIAAGPAESLAEAMRSGIGDQIRPGKYGSYPQI
jgi:hypothetical protein